MHSMSIKCCHLFRECGVLLPLSLFCMQFGKRSLYTYVCGFYLDAYILYGLRHYDVRGSLVFSKSAFHSVT